MQAGLDAPDEHLAAQRGMTTRKFLQATAGLRARCAPFGQLGWVTPPRAGSRPTPACSLNNP